MSLSGLCFSYFVCFIQLVIFVAYLFIIFPCGFNICKTIGMTPFISDIVNCIFPLFLFSLAGSLSVFQLCQRTSFWFHFFSLLFFYLKEIFFFSTLIFWIFFLLFTFNLFFSFQFLNVEA